MNAVSLHPWNINFEWIDAAPSGKRLTSSETDAFNRDGFVVLHDALPVSLVDDVRAATDTAERAYDEELTAMGGREGISEKGAMTVSAHLVLSSDVLRDLSTHELFLDLALDLVGTDVNLYWDQAVYKKPEKPRRFPWHQDNGYTFVVPQQYLTCWIPLTEATLDNGCPQIAPGLHRSGTLEHVYVDPLGWQCFEAPPGEVVAAPVVPGDVVVFSSLAPHLTGPNVTDSVRKAYLLQYAPAGAEVLQGDPKMGAPTGKASSSQADYQYPVLRGGTVQN
jgi:ectoine hydroxylase-related dioxygenase (phytanoyl-CoA dioxygenase family)